MAFGAAFVLLRVVTARLDESERAEEVQMRARGLADGLAAGVGFDGSGLDDDRVGQLLSDGLLDGVQIVSPTGSAQTWGEASGSPDASARTEDGAEVRTWVPVRVRGDAVRRSLFVFYLGLTALVILLIAYVLLTYFLVRPIDDMRRASERVAAGNLQTRVPVRGAAEVARLASSFNEMASQLREDRESLQRRLHELEETTAELTATQERLVRSARLAAVGRLSAGVAHEIGNPLAAIRGMLELIRGGDLDRSEEREFVERIEKETERIHRTIRDLLDFSRDEPTSIGRIESSASLAEVVEDTVKLIDRQARFREIELELALDASLPRVRGDHERLRQLLLNLLFNAADALEGKGTIAVRAGRGANTTVRLVVSDDGPGIEDAILDQVFDPFVTTKPAGQGTGLGLAVCHTIVERLGGSIRAENSERGGASFEVSLPAAL